MLALRVKDYTPQWLDQLCFTGQVGRGRLSVPQTQAGRPFAPVRSSPMSLFRRENLSRWLDLMAPPETESESANRSLSPDTGQVWETLAQGGALYFTEIVRQTRLLPSRVEQALAELTAQGRVTADSFEGLRALLFPSEKRKPFSGAQVKRHHKSITSVEYAGRWSLLRPAQKGSGDLGEALEHFAWILLRRYGVVFRRLLEREALKAPWFELHRIYRKLEARAKFAAATS